jgi:hypothetical protein
LDPGKGKSALSKAERQEDEVNLLLGSFAVIRPELPGFVHVLADDLDVEDRFTISRDKVHP